MSWEPRHEYRYNGGVLIQHRIQRTEGGEWEDFVEETVEPPKQRMRMKAFPDGYTMNQRGMDLRDYFAAMAMESFLTHQQVMEELHKDDVVKTITASAYKIADLMMKAREDD